MINTWFNFKGKIQNTSKDNAFTRNHIDDDGAKDKDADAEPKTICLPPVGGAIIKDFPNKAVGKTTVLLEKPLGKSFIFKLLIMTYFHSYGSFFYLIWKIIFIQIILVKIFKVALCAYTV